MSNRFVMGKHLEPPPFRIHVLWGLLPYVATFAGLWILQLPLVAVGIYHLGILFLLAKNPTLIHRLFKGVNVPLLAVMILLCLLIWPLILFLWPIMQLPGVDLANRIQEWGLTGPMVYGFILYSITLHPILEEAFWRGLMPDRLMSDLLFAGFHILVMVLFLSWPWVLLGTGILTLGAWLWRTLTRKTGGLFIAIVSHAAADLAIVIGVVHLVE